MLKTHKRTDKRHILEVYHRSQTNPCGRHVSAQTKDTYLKYTTDHRPTLVEDTLAHRQKTRNTTDHRPTLMEDTLAHRQKTRT